ncbi:MAG TPA: MATE family efflux transporter [Mesotoga sp.]|mgnify:FL=1|jgi:putative MATE family efflux protein|nr:MATE family efflux transporter [Mesotoga sp.]MDI9375888.1 MATE family efflux transporter [Thermotogota bacterium]NLX33995.1 MATE family efflux transporter [Thermotogaceae bacterium]MDD4040204.1 MATE family efflux transporter [Mesotoga sp.]HPB62862.1 MATE family efflux transporter [Mesotoga sp.]
MKEFTRRMLSIAIPITLQNLISTGLNLVDNLMVGQLGTTAIAAVGLVNQVVFILNLFTFGASSGAGIFVSQYWGKRDEKSIERTLGHIIYITMGAATVFFVLLYVFPEGILKIFTSDTEVIRLGTEYARPVAFSTFLTSFSFIMAMALRTVEKARIPLYISLVALSINTVGNYILIFGLGSIPAMGVFGASVATLVARIAEFFIFLYIALRRLTPIRFTLWAFRFDGPFFRRLMKYATPVIFNEFLWSLGVTVYSLVMARMGTEFIAARNISSTIENFGFVIFGGLASATVVMVGSELGRNNFTQARFNARKLIQLTVITAVATGLMIIFLSRFIVQLYNIDQTLKDIVLTVVVIVGLAQPIKMFNAVNIVGILRSGGDTKAAMLMEIFSLWGVGIPLVAIAGLVLKWSLPAVYIVMMVEELVKAILGIWRTKTGKWVRNVVD